MGSNNKGRRARHVIVIAGASGSGKTQLIRKMSQPPHDAFITSVLKQLDCDPDQRLKRSTVERMQRLMHPDNFKKRKTRKLETQNSTLAPDQQHRIVETPSPVLDQAAAMGRALSERAKGKMAPPISYCIIIHCIILNYIT